jgi:hypothetical protein
MEDEEMPPQEETAPGEEDDEANVSPEEQKDYDRFVHAAMDIIYTGDPPKVMPEVLQSLQAGAKPGVAPTPAPGEMPPQAPPAADAPAPGEAPPADGQEGAPQAGNPAVIALANTAVQITQKVDSDDKAAKKMVEDEVLYHAAREIVEQLADIAEAAGIHDYSEEEMNGAFFQAVDLYRPIAVELGRTTDDKLKEQFGEVEQADQNGKLGELLPGLGEPQAQA